jgi:hypothetical protein
MQLPLPMVSDAKHNALFFRVKRTAELFLNRFLAWFTVKPLLLFFSFSFSALQDNFQFVFYKSKELYVFYLSFKV